MYIFNIQSVTLYHGTCQKRKHKHHQLETTFNSIVALTWPVKTLQAYKTNYSTKLISLLF